MDLGLDITRVKGRAGKAVACAEIRDLTAADLALLETERGIQAPPIAKLRASHHALARALAAGCKPAEAGLITGYSASRISILQKDPSFIELMDLYRDQVQDNFSAGLELMKVAHVEMVEEIVDRVRDNPEKIEFNDLVTAAKTFSDRVGMGPATKNTNINVNVDFSAKLEAARRRAGMIEAVALPLPASIEEEPGA